jgi:hypothetical protein
MTWQQVGGFFVLFCFIFYLLLLLFNLNLAKDRWSVHPGLEYALLFSALTDARMIHAGIFWCSGFFGPHWEWKHRWTPAAGVGKILFVENRRERLHGGIQGDPETGGPLGQVGNWVFIALFVLPKGGDVSQVQTEVSWEGEMSPWPIIIFGSSCSMSFIIIAQVKF